MQSLVFCNHFEELQTLLFEVELIINNAPLIYVYPNTIGTCLTPNYLSFGRHLLLSSNTTSTVAANLRICNKFTWDTTNSKTKYKKRERYPDTFGELTLAEVLLSRDSEIRRTIVWIAKNNVILKHPVNKLVLIENTYQEPTKRVWQGNKS